MENHKKWLVVLGMVCGLLLPTSHVLAADSLPPTHEQARIIQPKAAGKAVDLHTFCLDSRGNILACCTSESQKLLGALTAVLGSSGTSQKKASGGMVLVISPEGETLKQVDLDFQPTAIDTSPDGSTVVAGEGQIRKFDSQWSLVAKSVAPNLLNVDMDKLRKQAEEAAKARIEEMSKMFSDEVANIKKRLKKMEDVAEEERSATEKAALAQLKTQLEFYEQQAKQMEKVAGDMFDIDSLLASGRRITGLAVSDKDIFVSCGARQGYGYDIWRVDHQLQNPVTVLKQMRGCCGQMDIHCCGADLVVAENTGFRVGIYDREGNAKTSYGERAGRGKMGFGSCCNPMNVTCNKQGDVLTAESSVGHIKRFNSAGELVANVGQAKITGGCTHTALGYDEKTNRVYVMHEEQGHICVLEPKTD